MGDMLCVHKLSQIISNIRIEPTYTESRQFDLTIDKRCITQSSYLRLYTTMVRMNAVDAQKISRIKENTNMTVKEYVDILAADMIKAAKKCKESSRPSPTLISIATNRIDTDIASISLLSDFSRVI